MTARDPRQQRQLQGLQNVQHDPKQLYEQLRNADMGARQPKDSQEALAAEANRILRESERKHKDSEKRRMHAIIEDAQKIENAQKLVKVFDTPPSLKVRVMMAWFRLARRRGLV